MNFQKSIKLVLCCFALISIQLLDAASSQLRRRRTYRVGASPENVRDLLQSARREDHQRAQRIIFEKVAEDLSIADKQAYEQLGFEFRERLQLSRLEKDCLAVRMLSYSEATHLHGAAEAYLDDRIRHERRNVEARKAFIKWYAPFVLFGACSLGARLYDPENFGEPGGEDAVVSGLFCIPCMRSLWKIYFHSKNASYLQAALGKKNN